MGSSQPTKVLAPLSSLLGDATSGSSSSGTPPSPSPSNHSRIATSTLALPQHDRTPSSPPPTPSRLDHSSITTTAPAQSAELSTLPALPHSIRFARNPTLSPAWRTNSFRIKKHGQIHHVYPCPPHLIEVSGFEPPPSWANDAISMRQQFSQSQLPAHNRLTFTPPSAASAPKPKPCGNMVIDRSYAICRDDVNVTDDLPIPMYLLTSGPSKYGYAAQALHDSDSLGKLFQLPQDLYHVTAYIRSWANDLDKEICLDQMVDLLKTYWKHKGAIIDGLTHLDPLFKVHQASSPGSGSAAAPGIPPISKKTVDSFTAAVEEIASVDGGTSCGFATVLQDGVAVIALAGTVRALVCQVDSQGQVKVVGDYGAADLDQDDEMAKYAQRLFQMPRAVTAKTNAAVPFPSFKALFAMKADKAVKEHASYDNWADLEQSVCRKSEALRDMKDGKDSMDVDSDPVPDPPTFVFRSQASLKAIRQELKAFAQAADASNITRPDPLTPVVLNPANAHIQRPSKLDSLPSLSALPKPLFDILASRPLTHSKSGEFGNPFYKMHPAISSAHSIHVGVVHLPPDLRAHDMVIMLYTPPGPVGGLFYPAAPPSAAANPSRTNDRVPLSRPMPDPSAMAAKLGQFARKWTLDKLAAKMAWAFDLPGCVIVRVHDERNQVVDVGRRERGATEAVLRRLVRD
ncbi:hypothetical protein BCR44DRAFT_1428085 [Catenaria anguillulae PL171]|uniref:Uncharacterized protein n=1 Tax=Catenaria anguillulae PL171 TaxID=765915 RepID=A0A1Y2HWF2_9FUNG|nr:hypothetical protein BCR44DRAFT_1428085 [Catenaria anguillulae PL171]